MYKNWLLLVFLCIGIASHAQQNDFEKIGSTNFKRLYRLNDSMFRSEQPSKKGFKELESLGVKTVLNLRRQKKDARKVVGTELQVVNLPLKAAELDETKIITVLKAIRVAESPVLIHCWHGSDRTGAIAAAYRMVFERWPKEKAIAEFRYREFGYHEKMYPNLVTLLLNLDIARIQKEIGI